MASNQLAIRFTENDYATKSEVMKELKTPLIDSFWKIILQYRESFAHEISLKTINNSKLSMTLCPGVNNLISSGEIKTVSSISRFNELSRNSDDARLFKIHSKIEILKHLSSFKDFIVDDNYLRMLLTKNIKHTDERHSILLKYVDAINLLENNKYDLFDEDLIADLYSVLSDNNELISLYRTANEDTPQNKVIIDRLYSSAPSHLLPMMMSSLCSYVQSGSGSILTKAAVVLYYINYAKPFSNYNEEMALLLSKYVLAANGLDSFAYYLPLERLYADKYVELLKICTEVQKTDDITYFVRYFIKQIISSIEDTYSIMNNVQALLLIDEYYSDARKETNTVQETLLEEPVTIKEEVVETKQIVPEEVIEKPIIKEEVVSTNNEVEISSLAISYLPPELDEKAARRLEEDLLESDPELRRPQAKFYARHCTMGKRYTIQQFKKAINCAYETARTSMDGLVTLGYYRQEMVKNKKVYTPIKRK